MPIWGNPLSDINNNIHFQNTWNFHILVENKEKNIFSANFIKNYFLLEIIFMNLILTFYFFYKLFSK